ncbi:MAG: hypothetical protein LAT67_09350 [Balneolales bacterium]|nr:hypothetical protein [Balneolales bacterium]
MPEFELPFYMQHILLGTLAFFSVASFVLAVVTISNAYRLRNVLLVWRSGKFYGFPLFATFFMILSLVLGAIAWYTSMQQYYPVIGGYVLLSINWVISSYYMSKRYITDNGIVKNINDPSQTISWLEIHDFVEKSEKNGNLYSFLYLKDHHANKSPLEAHRLEIEVPTDQVNAFRKILNHKLGRRFQHTFSDTSQHISINLSQRK